MIIVVGDLYHGGSSMAFNGSMQDFSVIQILNLIRLALRTGKLSFLGTYSSDLFFSEGELIFAQQNEGEQDLLQTLLESGKLSEIQVSHIREQAADVEAEWMSVWLLESGYVTKADLAQATYRQVLDTVYATILYADGEFSFESGTLPSLVVPITAIDLREIIEEGDRLVKEWEMVQTAVPSLNICLQPTEQLTPAAGRLLMSKLEWAFASTCTAHRSVQQIAQTLNLDNFRAKRIVHQLLKLDMVKIVAMATPTVQPTQEATPPPKFESAIQSLRANLQRNLVPSW